MIEGRTILCFASGYDAPPTSKHHLMGLLAEQNTVLWINYHGSRRPTVGRADISAGMGKLRQIARGLQHRGPNLWVLTPPVVPLPSSRWARCVNRRLLRRRIDRALRRVGGKPLQVWTFAPDVAHLLDDLDAEKVVYYCVDDFSQFAGYDAQQILADEADLCRRADLVVTTSRALQAAKAPLNPNTILVSHGVDYEHFARALDDELAMPQDVAEIPQPRLGFFGLIHDWVDIDLLAAVAALRPQWRLVLIGDANTDTTPLQRLANVHLLGRRPYEQLPAYCRAFDVGLIPFVINDLTRSVNPIKLREYLAAGLPVVATPLPEVARNQPYVTVADGPDGFVAAIESALAQPSDLRTARSRSMAGETWGRKLWTVCDALAHPPAAVAAAHAPA